MSMATIRVPGFGTLTGLLIEHLGGRLVGIDVDGRRYVGRLAEPPADPTPAPAPAR